MCSRSQYLSEGLPSVSLPPMRLYSYPVFSPINIKAFLPDFELRCTHKSVTYGSIPIYRSNPVF